MASDETGLPRTASSPRNGHSNDPPGQYATNFSSQGTLHSSDSNPNATIDHKMNINSRNATNDNGFMGTPDSVKTSTESSESLFLSELCLPCSPRRATSAKDSDDMCSIPSASVKSPPEDPPSSSFDVTQIFSNHSLIEKEAKRYAKNNNFIITDRPKQNLSVDCFVLLHPDEDLKKVPFRGLFYSSPMSSNRAKGVGCPFKICYLYHPDKGHYTI